MKRQSIFMGSTSVSAEQTVGEISSCLIRAGARQIATDFGPSGRIESVKFTLHLEAFSAPVSFRLPCRTDKLLKLLRNDRAQAERTGWRQVLRWVQAQMAMIEVGMVKTHEVFQPYAVIPGTEQTMFEAWESHQRLLTAPQSATERMEAGK